VKKMSSKYRGGHLGFVQIRFRSHNFSTRSSAPLDQQNIGVTVVAVGTLYTSCNGHQKRR